MTIETLAQWLEREGLASTEEPASIADVDRVRAILVAAARDGRAVSYSELLGELGHRFTRPKMRAVCKTLDRLDEDAKAAGEPALAVLVVRESDRLPGQGWWTACAERLGYKGAWIGAEAADFIRSRQDEVFAYWRARQDSNLRPRA
jgi:hypothetical protein